MRPVVVQRRAEQDLFEAIDHYAADTTATVDRFLAAVDRVMATIGRSPQLGSSSFAELLDIDGLRFQPLKGFPYAAFYVFDDERVLVIRVLHHARDVASLLDEE